MVRTRTRGKHVLVSSPISLLTLLTVWVADPGPAPDTVDVDARPLVEIGASAADPHDQLYGVTRVLRGPNGGLLVVEASAGRIRSYDASGRFVRDLGGRGEGPGEFRDIVDVSLSGDALLVLDRDGSVTRLGLDGAVLATWRIDVDGLVNEAYNPVPAGVLPDGRVVIRANERVFGRPDGEYVQHVGFLTVGPRDQADTLAFVPSRRVHSDQGLPRPYRPWVEAEWRAGAGALWMSAPVEGRIVKAASAVRITLPDRGRSPSTADLDHFRERYVARGGSENDRRVIADWVDESPVAEALPPLRSFTVDGLGRVWVEAWPPSPDQTVWEVFDSAGRSLVTVRIPRELRLEDAGEDWICGVWTDPLGVERVRVHALPPLRPGLGVRGARLTKGRRRGDLRHLPPIALFSEDSLPGERYGLSSPSVARSAAGALRRDPRSSGGQEGGGGAPLRQQHRRRAIREPGQSPRVHDDLGSLGREGDPVGRARAS